MTPEELVKRIRAGIGAGDRLVPGAMAQEEDDALAALDELLALIDRTREQRDQAESALRFYAEYGQDTGAWARNYFTARAAGG